MAAHLEQSRYIRTLVGPSLCTLLLSTTALAQSSDTTRTEPRTKPAEQTAQADTQLVWVEALVVTASRTEQRIRQAPATMSVVTSKVIETAPSINYGDLLRSVPGVNVTQLSARDVQVVPRGSAGTLANSQLAVVDGRQVNLDLFGFVMWDLLPVDASEVKQIEVMRTPGSAVWGANALSGVVNVISKSPREMAGTEIVAGGGELQTLYGRINHAGVRNKLGYKISASGYRQDPFPRPTGTIPGTTTPYPPYDNQGTVQPKFDARVDYDQTNDERWSFSGGYAGSDGMLHSGIGPFDVESGTFLAYGRAEYRRDALRISAFSDILDGDATNLLTVDTNGMPISFSFETQTYTLDVSHSTPIGDINRLTYGAKGRYSDYAITLAPEADNRTEIGAFVQDELQIVEPLRVIAGVRWDDLDPSGTAWSPRASVVYSPHRSHTLRASFNQAFRAPSVINNYIDVTTANQVLLPPAGTPFVFPSEVKGNPDLEGEKVIAYEAGYEATFFERVNLSLAVYRNHRKDGIDFYPSSYYSSANPPPGWPLPPAFVPPNQFPESFSYRNQGEVIDKGVEVGLQYFPHYAWSTFANYSFQDDPEVRDGDRGDINTPPKHRVNVGVAYDGDLFFGNADVNYVDKAFWVDVLDSRFWGPTDEYTQVNASIGIRLMGGQTVVSVKGTNLFDAKIQQHVFGDIITRKVVGEVRVRLP